MTRYGFPFHRRPVPIVGDVPTVRPPKGWVPADGPAPLPEVTPND
ncbi:hypothetical protein ACFRCR_16610 [Oerskovia sp. NPDC056781]